MAGEARKGLSPLLAIIIGLIVTIVAGILLAQLYFSYAATISARPAANIEYIDLVVDSGGNGHLVINIKNTGNVPIDNTTITSDLCSLTVNGPGTPGSTLSATCTISGVSTGDVLSGTITVGFTDGSVQSYAISVRARSA
ncbi:MAG: hypothetical protein DRN47_03470 [Candidatus Wolframiiraptor sp.]|nr:MAG: hypothetical protein DRN47_03470 [Candidatus Wolframiiraptor sp.]